jgi:hypothetical protein
VALWRAVRDLLQRRLARADGTDIKVTSEQHAGSLRKKSWPVRHRRQDNPRAGLGLGFPNRSDAGVC